MRTSTWGGGVIAPSEITSESIYHGRRQWLKQHLGLSAALLAGVTPSARAGWFSSEPRPAEIRAPLTAQPNPRFGDLGSNEPKTSLANITSYGNFYEFGPDKSSPGEEAYRLRIDPWQIAVTGAVKKDKVFSLDSLLKLAPLEERVYRMRCVEGWSMVVPWIGYPLAELIKRADPLGDAKYVAFYSLADREQMPYIKYPFLPWPYMEAVRIDEAMHPLTLLTFGLYGAVLPRANGAPVRLVMPWKYGFKGAKSIVEIKFLKDKPETIWTRVGGDEYGFFANVNPDVPHKRWSQASERRIGEFFRRKTLLFNGYADAVESLYRGMDLRVHF